MRRFILCASILSVFFATACGKKEAEKVVDVKMEQIEGDWERKATQCELGSDCEKTAKGSSFLLRFQKGNLALSSDELNSISSFFESIYVSGDVSIEGDKIKLSKVTAEVGSPFKEEILVFENNQDSSAAALDQEDGHDGIAGVSSVEISDSIGTDQQSKVNEVVSESTKELNAAAARIYSTFTAKVVVKGDLLWLCRGELEHKDSEALKASFASSIDTKKCELYERTEPAEVIGCW